MRAARKGKTIADDQDADAAAAIAAWITQARTCNAPAIATFASVLDADIAAVRAAFTAMEQQPGRRLGQPAHAHQAPMLRAAGPRNPELPQNSDRPVHKK